MSNSKTLQEIKASLDKLDTKFKEARAAYGDCATPNPDLSNQIWDICYNMMDGLRQYVYTIADDLSRHCSDGHIPPIRGAERMNKALKAVGLDGDYKAEPREIYANSKYEIKASKGQFEINLVNKV